MEIKLFDKWWLQLTKGIFFTLAGILILNFGPYKYLMNPLFAGIFLMIFGILDIFTSLSNRTLNYAWQWLLAEGLQYLFFGLILMMKQDITFSIVKLLFGILAMFTGILHFSASINFRNAGVRRWFAATFNGLVSAGLSIVIIFYPEGDQNMGAIIIASYIIAEGVLVILNSLLLEQVAFDYS
ncbi:MAG: DUF308 domain-containing protein [Spirochaetia bacterium]|jgi:uncharacterized membrane protein HdeD (DUF308 family)|nr:DUF308 domain-containing protein [Spirochaetia bacterium]